MMTILQIVRDFGPVGGMERYVWELCHHLPEQGFRVDVLCEHCHAGPDKSLTIHEIGGSRFHPRWLSALDFSHRAARWHARHARPGVLIHSHDTTGFHHVATFHGPPFAEIRSRPLWKRISPRVAANLWIERRQLLAPSVRAIIPNSEMIARKLLRLYPEIAPRLEAPILPGVASIPMRDPAQQRKRPHVIGFVGREWKRKGLDIAVHIVRQMLKDEADLELVVIGPDPAEIRPLLGNYPGPYRLLGGVDASEHYRHFDLLLHPARMEPFGMVIAEALSAGVPVLASDQCGAASILDANSILPVNAPLECWVQRGLEKLARPVTPFRRSWDEVAAEHAELYRRLV
ncbi:MAG: glycosyltransferase [Caldilineae bacterium]|nr:MAG: glycosyltransferase [Caldilineae bacterium]